MVEVSTRDDEKTIELLVAQAPASDTGRGIARIDPEDIKRIGAAAGDAIEISGRRAAYAAVFRTATNERGRGSVQIDDVLRHNAKVKIGEPVTIRKAARVVGEKVVLAPHRAFADRNGERTQELKRHLQGMVVHAGDRVSVDHGALPSIDLTVQSTEPEGAVEVTVDTALEVTVWEPGAGGERTTYADVGGLDRQLQQMREVVELPLKYPEVFHRLGIEPPKGVLLYGPPGSGKTLMARAVAGETSAHFLHVSGPEIFNKYYGESESRLREVFKEATENAPSIIFLDEIDAIAAKREDVYGEVEKRVVAQLMALLDGLESRGQVMVIAATNTPDALDPALRRPGRFDREIHVSASDFEGRLQILKIHTRTMPLAAEVDLDQIADLTNGYVGADLANLCREAAMIRLRKEMPTGDLALHHVSPEKIASLVVTREDFLESLRGLRPSAMRRYFAEGESVGWNMVGGLEEAKQTLQEAIEWPIKYPGLFRYAHAQPVKGIVLSGPSGSGKSLLARAVATESKSNFITVKGPDLYSKWVGDSEKAVRELFKTARMTAPSILFFDELDALAPARGGDVGGSQVTERVISQILQEIDDSAEVEGIILVGATSRLDVVDPALLSPGRFEVIVDLPLPDRAARLDIFRIHIGDTPLAPDVNLDILADLTDGRTGGDIAFMCRRATLLAIREFVEKDGETSDFGKFAVAARHMRKAIEQARRSVRTNGASPSPEAEAAPAMTPVPAATAGGKQATKTKGAARRKRAPSKAKVAKA